MIMNDYFDWMYASVNTDPDGNVYTNYVELCHYLHSVNFNYILPMDSNRESDGITLRYHFGYEKDIPSSIIASELDCYPCSVFEMMVALARRIEADVMGDNEFGNRTSVWFHAMLSSMGLDKFVDGSLNEDELELKLERCLNRQFEYNGKGGFFTLRNPSRNLQEVEIWSQAMWFLNEYS